MASGQPSTIRLSDDQPSVGVPSPNVPSDNDQPSANVPNPTDESVNPLTKEMGRTSMLTIN